MSTAVNASRLGQMKARFQQKQMQEKEEKLTRLYETQQQRALDRVVTSRTNSRNTTTVTRNNTMGYSSGETSPGALSSSGSSTLSSQLGGGRVRQMFEERRTHTKAAGIDKSYPLEPIKGAKSSTHRTERTTSLDRNSTFTKGHSKFSSTTKRVIDNQHYNSNTTLNYHNNNEINNKHNNNFNESNDFDSSDIENHNDTTEEQIMNKHNLYETSIDDEMFPDVQLIDDDLDVTFGKMSNTSNLLRRQLPTSNERLNALASRTQQKRAEPIKPRHEKLVNSKSNGISSNVEKLPLQRSNTVQQQRKQQVGDGDSVKNNSDSKSSVRSSVTNGRKVAAMNKVSTPPKKVMPTPISTFKKVTSPSVTPRQSPIKSSATTPVKAEIKTASPSKSPSKTMTTNTINSASPRRTLANSVSDDNLKPCRNCSRRFAVDRLQKHEEICMKTANKKRKPYDALKHRVLGTEAEAFVAKPGKNAKQAAAAAPVKKNAPDWRRKHEEFIQAIRAAKQVQAHLAAGGNIRDLPPPPPSSNPDYVQCPHCGRKFNESAAERHIPKCANYSYNKPKPAANKNAIKKR
ncbi:zinc finger C2HC domain-containing protein 1C isoform X1 [Chrysoperla carnea]|uniref:zinc finger C2HC domain-containing protein 1C isoform X1 n=1 Tax=Chrysoperla carnea TaxID=189513 RepID=UPI001D074DC1|nr:zinc finger C2HC domain-containing protein 1C isoform X1 [Chrysoperla carnea]